MSVTYNDNLRLINANTAKIWGAVVNAGLRMKRAEGRGYLSVVPSVRSSRYDSNEPLSSTDQDLKGSWEHDGEKGDWHMDAEWIRDTTLTSELAVSGLVQAQKRRLQRYLSPSYSYAWSPRSTLAADIAYTMDRYDDAQFTGLVDYDYARADLSMNYQWSEQSTVTGAAYGARMNASRTGYRSDTVGMQLRLDYKFGERWGGSFGAGAYRSHDRGGGAYRGGGLMDVNVNRKDEIGQWSIGVNRSIDPSGTGVLVRRDQLNITREQIINDWWRLTAKGYWTMNKDLQTVPVNGSRDYRSATLVLSRVLTRTWSADGVYSYAVQRYAGVSGRAEQNSLMAEIHYSGIHGTE